MRCIDRWWWRGRSRSSHQTEHTLPTFKNLLDGNLDINKLVLSKQIKAVYKVRKNKETKEIRWNYIKQNKKELYDCRDIQQPHVRLAQALVLRDPVNHPKPPDRVPYLFVENKNAILQCDKVIHPNDFNSTHKVDSMYYFEHQYKKPIDMIFELMSSKEETQEVYKEIVHKKIESFFRPHEETKEITNIKIPSKTKEIKEATEVYGDMVIHKINEINKQAEISSFFKPRENHKEIIVFKWNPEMMVNVDDDDQES